MYPVIDSEPWLNIKIEPVEDIPTVGNVSRSWQWRERGIDPPNYPPNKQVFENIAEDILVQKPLQIRSCDLPGYPRSTFLMVFSPDGTKVASTHGNHNVYVSELASGKHVRILKGHPRTPWCIAFHPSHPQLIGSGCLGGQVRVWDISSGGSEVWNVRNETVIASIAFHPREQLLVIATYNELYFWDWSHPAPFTKVSTNNVNEKVRFVAFDSLGYKLITGISLWACSSNVNTIPLSTSSSSSSGPSSNSTGGGRGDNNDDSPATSRIAPDSPGAAQDMIVNSYQTLVQRYDSLVRNYQRLFMVRHRLIHTPPPPNTIDRGTDPMEAYPVEIGRRRRLRRSNAWTSNGTRSTEANSDNTNPAPSTSRRQDGGDSGDGDTSSSRFLNLDVLSFDSDASRTQDSPSQERSPFGSRSSAFQPLNESGRSFRTVDQNERTRLLPNPFSSRSGNTAARPGDSAPATTSASASTSASAPRSRRLVLERSPAFTNLHSSRTSIFTSSRSDSSLGRDFALRRRNAAQSSQRSAASRSSPSAGEPTPSTSSGPATTNSSTQMSPDADNVDAQSINESLDLIRDILRDSGTRLLNLITNMSMNLMEGRSEEGEGEGEGEAPRRRRPRMRLFTGDLRRDFLASSSDSEGDHTDILRTLNEAFREPEAGPSRSVPEAGPSRGAPEPLTDRVFFEIGDAALSSEEFLVRTHSGSAPDDPLAPATVTAPAPATVTTPAPAPATTPAPAADRDAEEPHPTPTVPDFDPSIPSTSSRDFWLRGPDMSSAEAYRRVRSGVSSLQKHTLDLAHTWLRGERLTMKQLRLLWETLRRRILALQRETVRHDSPGYYTRSLLERCMILTEMTDIASRHSSRRLQSSSRNGESQRGSRDNAPNPETASTSAAATEAEASTSASAESRQHSRPAILRSSRSSGSRAFPFFRRRQPTHRWHTGEGPRRRPNQPRPRPRYTRRDFQRMFVISSTRHEIRMRAMQVLSVMFSLMMKCLGEPGLSQVIMHMLKALKKALALSCFMMMSNRTNTASQSTTNAATPTQNMESMDVVRIQNAEHTGPVNVDGPDDPASPRVNIPDPNQTEERTDSSSHEQSGASIPADADAASTSQAPVVERDTQKTERPPVSPEGQRLSHRLAVQIAAANRNNSSTARTRRDLYMECKRQKALHRTNPAAHPFTKRRFPPVSTHRIPVLRSLPGRMRSATSRNAQNEEPTAGPSNAPQDNPNQEAPRGEMNEFDNRVNLIRIAHMQAVRLRNAARNRFRRLQTIRLYTPSSVFALQSRDSNETPQENGESASAQNEAEGSRRPFVSYSGSQLRLPPRSEANARSNETGQFHPVLNNVAMPLMQVMTHDLPPSSAAQGNQAQRLPRIHEYLQPIILAQNAMVVEDEGDGGGGGGGNVGGLGRRMGGMAGLLDASIISEALPAPANRVQAWDFTTGQTPDIADSSKNVVVQRCRIHNDASIDISKDGRLLVALLPGGNRVRNTNSWLGVYSLEWARLGQCLHTAMLEQSAVSVALSPTARYLAVGLGSRRFTSAPHSRTNIIALLYKLDPLENSSRTGLSPIKELMQHWEHGFTSLNCLRWAPQPGQGLVYANNTGQLIIMS